MNYSYIQTIWIVPEVLDVYKCIAIMNRTRGQTYVDTLVKKLYHNQNFQRHIVFLVILATFQPEYQRKLLDNGGDA